MQILTHDISFTIDLALMNLGTKVVYVIVNKMLESAKICPPLTNFQNKKSSEIPLVSPKSFIHCDSSCDIHSCRTIIFRNY